jgi:serine/threonine-protein kinase
MDAIEQLNAALAGRYVIERHIGEGGMATVFLARDLKHDRQVALKVLKPELGAVLGVERFLSEIKVTANLQHPNLLPLFDSGAAEGLLFYVMPYVQGESLRVRLDREKQLPIDEAVRLSVAIASALDYAHRHGVIHRDLKPENILLHDGQPVIADFGIALAVSNAGGARVTQTGLSLGTPQYMSPEQASGDRAIDARSDIYSLAAVTYEMLAGEPPHSGSTAQAIIAKLMTADPQPLSSLRKSAPVHVEAAIERALAKLPADRFSTAKEFAEAMEGRGFALNLAATTSRQLAAQGRTAARHPLVIGASAVAVASLALAAYALTRGARDAGNAGDSTVRFAVELPTSMLTGGVGGGANVAVSKDGKRVAFLGATANGVAHVFVRALDAVEAKPVAGTDGAVLPFFSPDGESIGFFAEGHLWSVPIAGGTRVDIAEVTPPAGASWSPSGQIVVAIANQIIAIPSRGGAPRRVAAADTSRGEAGYVTPVALADGDQVLIAIQGRQGAGASRLGVLSLRSGKVTPLALPGLYPLGVGGGVLVYVTGTSALFGVRYDASGPRITGDPFPLGVNVLIRPQGFPDAAMSAEGTLMFQTTSLTAQVGLVDMTGQFTPVIAEPRAYAYPRYSPEGKRIALSIGTIGRSDIWVYDVPSASLSRLTSEGSSNERPEWTPDGKRVLFRSDSGVVATSAMWWRPADLSGPVSRVLPPGRDGLFEGVVTPDGKNLVYQVDNSGASQSNVAWRALSGDTVEHVISATPAVEAQPRVSPDGKWVAFATDASGAGQVVVQPFPGPGPQVQVSVAGGSEPVWGRDGKRLFYRDGQKFIAASYSASPTFTVTARAKLFDDVYAFAQSPHANYDVSPDGMKFLVVRNAEASRLVVVHNWMAEVRVQAVKKR